VIVEVIVSIETLKIKLNILELKIGGNITCIVMASIKKVIPLKNMSLNVILSMSMGTTTRTMVVRMVVVGLC
jgi:hypothetical protein